MGCVRVRAALCLLAVLAAAGCGRVESLRLAHANDGTRAEWPAGVLRVEMELLAERTGQPWVGVSVDGNPPAPFLLQNASGAVAVTGARLPRPLPAAIGGMTGVERLLPGIPGGRLVHNRRLGLGEVTLLDQGLLIVEQDDWPHARPGGGAAGVIGYDLFRRFAVEIDRPAGRVALLRPGSVELPLDQAWMRLAILGRRPYVELRHEGPEPDPPWARMQIEVGWPGGACLDRDGAGGHVLLAERPVPVDTVACDPRVLPADPAAERDGVLGYGALAGLRLLLDYPGGRAVAVPSP